MQASCRRNLPGLLPVFLVGLALLLCPVPALSQETLETQGLKFRLIPGGTYLLGSPKEEPGRYADEALPYRVKLPAFYMAVTETTNAQYARFLKATGHAPPLYWQDKNLNAPDQPVVGVTWEDALTFCQWLSQASGLPCRLPSEPEWEAAARGRLTGQPFPWGAAAPDDGGRLRANYRTNDLAQHPFRLTAAVGSFAANGFGLYDLAGNVAEWCQDRYRPMGSGGPFKPKVLKLLKGGSWYSSTRDLRCAARQSASPRYADGYIGFRVACSPLSTH